MGKPPSNNNNNDDKETAPQAAGTAAAPGQKEEKEGIRGILSFRNILDGFHAVFRPRPGNMRTHVLLLIFCFEMERFTNVGSGGSFYLYLRRQLEFQLEDLAIYNTVGGESPGSRH